MRPALLPRNEVDKRKSEEKRQRNEEGLRIAERIDVLREISASEGTAFEEYRVATLTKIQEEIQEEFKKLEKIKAEVKSKDRFLVEMEKRESRQKMRESLLDEREDYLKERFKRLQEIINEISE